MGETRRLALDRIENAESPEKDPPLVRGRWQREDSFTEAEFVLAEG